MTSFRILRNAAAVLAFLLLARGPALAADDNLIFLLGDTTPPLMNALNLIANGAGFYKAEHLNVTTRLLANGSTIAAHICASGTVDVCPMGIESAITSYGQGDHLKMFLTRASKFGYVIAVLDSSPIKTLADFKGKSIGVHTVNGGPSASLATQSSLASAGLTPADYKFVSIGMSDTAASALTSGRVDAAALPVYELIPYMVSGLKLRIFYHPTLEDSANAGYLAAPSILASKHDAIQRFSRAIVKAALLIDYHPDAAAKALLTATGKPFTPEDLKSKTAELSVWRSDLPAANPDSRRIGAPSMTGMQAYIKLLQDAGALQAPVPVAEVATDEFAAFSNDFDRNAIKNFAN